MPQRFHERNRGITVAAHDVNFDNKTQQVALTLSERDLHGVIDGAHTLHAILEGQKKERNGGWPAQVFFMVKTGIEPDQIAEVAGGLNTSQQVDLKSLENLRSNFERLKEVIADEPYAEKIAYKMNEAKPIDVREILYYMACVRWKCVQRYPPSCRVVRSERGDRA